MWIESLEDRKLLAGEFSLVMMPDTQVYAESYPAMFDAQTQWIADNKTAQNIAFVTHVGDVVNNPTSNTQWTRADAAMDKLDGVVPYGITIGNHDYDVDNNRAAATKFISYFGASRYSSYNWFGGVSPDGRNYYQRFAAGPWEFIHFNLEWEADDADLAWAQGVINANPNTPVMMTTHQYLKPDGTRNTSPGAGGNSGEQIWQEWVRKNKNVFMVFCGHYTGEALLASNNDAGQPVFQMLTDFQGRVRSGDGLLRVLKFIPSENRIEVKTYSPYTNQYETDANSQFSINVNFATRFGTAQSPVIVSAPEVLADAKKAEARPTVIHDRATLFSRKAIARRM
jgi:hypothetical protein